LGRFESWYLEEIRSSDDLVSRAVKHLYDATAAVKIKGGGEVFETGCFTGTC
jgi:hypothetical protein